MSPLRITTQAIFFVAVFLFWAVGYPYALAWQEQFQLFLLTPDYFTDRLALPGGLACYIGEFIAQFYNNPYLGATFITLLLLTVQILTEKLLPRTNLAFSLSFLPSVALFLLLGDDNLLPAFVVSFIFALATCYIRSTTLRFIAIPVIYWLAGPIVLIPTVIFAIREQRKSLAVAEIVLALACIFISSLFVPFYEIRVWSGLFYHRIVRDFHANILIFSILIIATITVGFFLKKDFSAKISLISTASLFVITALLTTTFYDSKRYEMIHYDFLVRTNQWNTIIKKAETKPPHTPMGVCALNLALGMNGELTDRAFDFFQHTTQGLVPLFDRDFATTLLTSELYFQLGLINTAQRLSFEAMEAIPDYRKSSRVIKRLAETNLINGQYDVARKYLNLLKKTVFYKKWAENRLLLIENSIKIDTHPLYGRMRSLRLKDDFLFSEAEIDKIFGQLFVHNQDNRLAMQYLLLYPLLDSNLENFMLYYSVVSSKIEAPRSRICRQAVALHFWQQKQRPPQGLIDEMTLRQLQDFMQLYQTYRRRVPQMDQYKSTFWYYLLDE